MQEQREKEILELQEKLEDFTQIKKTLEKHVNKHKIYEVKKRNRSHLRNSYVKFTTVSKKKRSESFCALICTLLVLYSTGLPEDCSGEYKGIFYCI